MTLQLFREIWERYLIERVEFRMFTGVVQEDMTKCHLLFLEEESNLGSLKTSVLFSVKHDSG